MHGHFEHLSETDIAWIAGLLEGEGSFMKPAKNDPYGMPRIQIQMTDHDVIEKIAKMFGVVAYKVKNPRYEQNGWKTPYMAFIRGSRAAEMMNIVKPYMGTRRLSQIDSALESYQMALMSVQFDKNYQKEKILKQYVTSTTSPDFICLESEPERYGNLNSVWRP
jgi:hypothetical protein